MIKNLIALISFALILGSIIFIFLNDNNEIDLESFINKNKIEYGSIENIISERRELDSTIWKDEVLAQLYEQSVVALWDSIRLKSNKYEQIENFSFKKIFLPKFSSKILIDKEIFRHTYSKDKESFNFRHWKKLLYGWRNNIILSHVEFHQKEFYSGKKNISVYSFTFHVKSKETRYILNGICNVLWSDKKDLNGNYLANELDVNALDILSYSGEDSFELNKVFGAEGDESFSGPGMPIALMDANDDNFPELIIISANKIYPNINGEFRKPVKLIRYLPENLITSSIFGDFNGNGYIDLFCFGLNMFPHLYEGNGTLTFTEKPKIINSILGPLTRPISSTSGDIDNDNDLDVWITQYKSPYLYGQMPTPYYDANDGFPSYLLINDGNGNFKDMTTEFQLDKKRYRRTYSSSFIDLNNDDLLDLITINDFAGIDVYLNNYMSFSDVTKEIISEKSSFGMSHSIGDYNLDGLEDLFVLGMSSTTANRLDQMNLNRPGYDERNSARSKMGYGNRLYTKMKNGSYNEPKFKNLNEIVKTGWSWGVTTFDFDNDMDSDLYITNGNMSKNTAKDYCSVFWRHDVYTGNSNSNKILKDYFADLSYNIASEGISWNPFETNHLIMNLNGNEFIKIGYLYGVALENDSRSTISADIDNDGLTDLIVLTTRHHSYFVDGKFPDESVYIFKNKINSSKDNNWIGVNLKSEINGFHPIGVKIFVAIENGKILKKSIINGDSFRSIHPTKTIFGLGKDNNVQYIEIKWPNGIIEKLNRPALDNYYTFPSNKSLKTKLSSR